MSSSVKPASRNRRTGPIAVADALSLALLSSSAERPSTSRRFTSLPSVAPTMRPAEEMASTTSGSGLFQVEIGWTPASMPVPTAAMGCALVKISASGPMPTSRYWLHAPCAISTCFSAIACGRAGLEAGEVVADELENLLADLGGSGEIAARALLDHAFQHRDRERDAAGLQRLQIAPASAATDDVGSRVSGGVLARIASSGPSGSPLAARSAAAGSAASHRSRMVGNAAEMSNTRPRRGSRPPRGRRGRGARPGRPARRAPRRRGGPDVPMPATKPCT